MITLLHNYVFFCELCVFSCYIIHIIFLPSVGPPENAMWALGDKIASSILAQTAGVPTLPWSGSGLKIQWSEADQKKGKPVTVSPDLYKKGNCGIGLFIVFSPINTSNK